MLQIGIDHAKQVRIRLRPAMYDGAGESTFTHTNKHPHSGIINHTLVSDVGRAIAAAVANDDEFAVNRCVRNRNAQAMQKDRNISSFIESGNYKAQFLSTFAHVQSLVQRKYTAAANLDVSEHKGVGYEILRTAVGDREKMLET